MTLVCGSSHIIPNDRQFVTAVTSVDVYEKRSDNRMS